MERISDANAKQNCRKWHLTFLPDDQGKKCQTVETGLEAKSCQSTGKREQTFREINVSFFNCVSAVLPNTCERWRKHSHQGGD